MRAKNVAGLTNNLRDSETNAIIKLKVDELLFGLLNSSPNAEKNSWELPITLDASGDVGVNPCLALVNGQPSAKGTAALWTR